MSPPHSQRLREIELVGQGAMAQVCRGVLCSERGVEKAVAVKRLRPELAHDPRAVDLFVHEAKITVRLSHPHLVQGLELGRDDNGYFLVCEWLSGVTAAELREHTGALAPSTAARLGQAVAEALAWLHGLRAPSGEDCTILHRDVTPGNVFVTREGVVKLMDFGVACCQGELQEPALDAMGTPGFAAPEQTEGKADARSDVFGLGMTLRALIEPGSALDEVLARATATLPDDRYPSASAFAGALAEAARSLPFDPQSLTERVTSTMAQRAQSAGPVRLDGAVQSILGGALSVQASTPAPALVQRRSPRRWMLSAGALAIGVVALVAVAAWPEASSEVPAPQARVETPTIVEPAPESPAPVEPPPPTKTAVAPVTTTIQPVSTRRPQGTGIVSINAMPWASVSIDGQARGNTPLRDLRLSVGEHRLTAEHPPAGLARTFTIVVEADRNQTFLLDIHRGTVTRRLLDGP